VRGLRIWTKPSAHLKDKCKFKRKSKTFLSIFSLTICTLSKFLATIFLRRNTSTWSKKLGVELTSFRTADVADELAIKARLQSTDTDTTTHFIRDHLLELSAPFLSKINDILISTLSWDLPSCDTNLYPKQTNNQMSLFLTWRKHVSAPVEAN
jgi:hypothetical protein